MALAGTEGWLFLLRWIHFLAGITWIGILYYFNFVQTPFFAETEPPVRSGAIQKLVPRALWWFRWGAMVTFLSGWLYLLHRLGQFGAGGGRVADQRRLLDSDALLHGRGQPPSGPRRELFSRPENRHGADLGGHHPLDRGERPLGEGGKGDQAARHDQGHALGGVHPHGDLLPALRNFILRTPLARRARRPAGAWVA